MLAASSSSSSNNHHHHYHHHYYYFYYYYSPNVKYVKSKWSVTLLISSNTLSASGLPAL